MKQIDERNNPTATAFSFLLNYFVHPLIIYNQLTNNLCSTAMLNTAPPFRIDFAGSG
jgi:hypothetical protein